jgi:hypothetical protein
MPRSLRFLRVSSSEPKAASAITRLCAVASRKVRGEIRLLKIRLALYSGIVLKLLKLIIIAIKRIVDDRIFVLLQLMHLCCKKNFI